MRRPDARKVRGAPPTGDLHAGFVEVRGGHAQEKRRATRTAEERGDVVVTELSFSAKAAGRCPGECWRLVKSFDEPIDADSIRVGRQPPGSHKHAGSHPRRVSLGWCTGSQQRGGIDDAFFCGVPHARLAVVVAQDLEHSAAFNGIFCERVVFSNRRH